MPKPKKFTDQVFLNDERLYRRVRRQDIGPNGKLNFEALEMPDMSVFRATLCDGGVEDGRKGYFPHDWGVATFCQNDIPTNLKLFHTAYTYQFKCRHVPLPGNHAHAEVRIWRLKDGSAALITKRRRRVALDPRHSATGETFDEDDIDKDEELTDLNSLDPDFHMKWRRAVAKKCLVELLPSDPPDDDWSDDPVDD